MCLRRESDSVHSQTSSQASSRVGIRRRLGMMRRTLSGKPTPMEGFARILLISAAALAVLGALLLVASKLGLSRLPGDSVVKRGNFTFYAPIGLMILLSIVLTIVLNA